MWWGKRVGMVGRFLWAWEVGLPSKFRSEKIPQNRLGTVSVIPQKKVLILRNSVFIERVNFVVWNQTERNGTKRNSTE
jgi:hypothetical protein